MNNSSLIRIHGFKRNRPLCPLYEVMVSVMKRPRSFTAENTVEINCHGGILIMNRILELVIRSGARLAEPGGF